MNYYIQGCAAKADKIKAAFKELGINVLDFGFADKAVVYCSIGECVQYLPYSINLMNILYSHPDYKELELAVKSKFKVGDWIVSPNGSQYLIAYIDKEDNRYLFEINEYTGEPMHYEDIQVVDGQYHHWTIQDAKDGDVLFSHCCKLLWIYKDDNSCYVGNNLNYNEDSVVVNSPICIPADVVPATKEQRDLLFHKMKKVGYQWDVDKKELRKIRPHYDISNFKPFDKVLVRDEDDYTWKGDIFLYHTEAHKEYPFVCVADCHVMCIPFNDDTKHLLGTTDMCDKQYINW